MKIVQNPESGEVGIQLKENEEYDIEEHLHSLMEFVAKEAVKTHTLINSCRKLVERLEVLEKR